MPAAPSVDVLGSGQAWQVLKNGQPLPVRYWSHDAAWMAAERIVRGWRRSSWTNRRCLTCNHAFLSQGAHHRMCDACRRQA